jgi:hypothetical protein
MGKFRSLLIKLSKLTYCIPTGCLNSIRISGWLAERYNLIRPRSQKCPWIKHEMALQKEASIL